MKIAFSGSRRIKPQAQSYITACINRCKELNATVIVGDNPMGVDAMVINACILVGVPVIVYGNFRPRLRIKGMGWHNCGYKGYNSWQLRDRQLVRDADIVMCVWDGKSHGTKAVYDFAIREQKQAHIKQI